MEFEKKSVEEVGAWLKKEGFRQEIVEKFEGKISFCQCKRLVM